MPEPKINWETIELLAKVRSAESKALVVVAGRIVRKAVPRAPRKTTALRGSIRHDPPVIKGDGASIQLGSFDIVYALRQEKGFHGADSLGRVYAQAGKHYLQSSYDEEAPGLAEQMRAAMRGGV